MPLAIAERPWSSVTMDFITDLPLSNGMTCVFTIVDRMSKMAHFIPIPKIPDAEETASLFLREVVRLHGLPNEVISDRGSQFVSNFWNAYWNCWISSNVYRVLITHNQMVNPNEPIRFFNNISDALYLTIKIIGLNYCL